MKSLLAPLFFRSRFCKHCAAIVKKQDPTASLGIYEFEAMPPLGGFRHQAGFTPDFPALLLFETFVVDGEAYERLTSNSRPEWVGPWPDLLVALREEGALELEDVVEAGRALSHQRGAMLRADMKRPEAWWEALAYYNSLMAQAEEFLGRNTAKAEELSWQFDPRKGGGVRGPDGHVHNIAVVLSEARDSSDEAHQALFDRAMVEVSGQLREVNACLAASSVLDAVPIMWAPYKRYLQRKLVPPQRDGFEIAEGAREFFNISFPAFAPLTVADFVRFQKDSRIQALREEIARAVQTSDIGDPAYPQRILAEVLRIERSLSRIRSVTGWIGSAIGLVPLPGAGMAGTAAAEVTSAALARRRRQPLSWFYMISDGRGGS